MITVCAVVGLLLALALPNSDAAPSGLLQPSPAATSAELRALLDERFADLRTEMQAMQSPPPASPDYSPILDAVRANDLGPVLAAVADLKGTVSTDMAALTARITALEGLAKATKAEQGGPRITLPTGGEIDLHEYCLANMTHQWQYEGGGLPTALAAYGFKEDEVASLTAQEQKWLYDAWLSAKMPTAATVATATATKATGPTVTRQAVQWQCVGDKCYQVGATQYQYQYATKAQANRAARRGW